MRNKLYILLILIFILSYAPYSLAQSTNDEIETYLNQVKSDLRKIFKPKSNLVRKATNDTVEISFSLNRKGYPGNVEIVESSGSKELDESIKETLLDNAPYLEIPESAMIEHADISFIFSLNSLNTQVSQKEILAYHKKVSKIITDNFKPPHFGTNKYASVRFVISVEGKVKDLEIIESSENEKFDEKCKKAILDSEPFPKPPAADLAINYSFSKKSPLNGFPIIIPIPIPH